MRHQNFTKMIFIVAGILTASVHASSDEAWKQHDQAVKEHCLKASHLKNVKVVSDIMPFDDQAGYSALVLEGYYSQSHMKRQKGRELCLYQRQQNKAFITEADTLFKPKIY